MSMPTHLHFLYGILFFSVVNCCISFLNSLQDGELKYTLYGVLVHAGWSTNSGHYYCFVRKSSGMWYSLDDNQVLGCINLSSFSCTNLITEISTYHFSYRNQDLSLQKFDHQFDYRNQDLSFLLVSMSPFSCWIKGSYSAINFHLNCV